MNLDQFSDDKWITIFSVQRSGTHALCNYFRENLNFQYREVLGEPLTDNFFKKLQTHDILLDRAICVIMMNQIKNEWNMKAEQYVAYQRILDKSITVKLKRNWRDVVVSHVLAKADQIWLDANSKDYSFYKKNISKKMFKEIMKETIANLKALDDYPTDIVLQYEEIQHLLNPTNQKLKNNKIDPQVYAYLHIWYDQNLSAALNNPL